MHRLIQRIVPLSLFLLVATGFGPVAVTAQTTPSLEKEGFELTVFGVSRYQETTTEVDRNGEPIRRNHALVEITMNPEVALPAFVETQSAVIHVASGSLQVTVTGGEAIVTGPGRSPEECENGSCTVRAGEEIVLGERETISLADASFEVRATGDDLTAFLMTLLVPLDDPRYRCWICPFF